MKHLFQWLKISRGALALWASLVVLLVWFAVELISSRTMMLKEEKYLEATRLMRNKLETLISEKKEALMLVSMAMVQNEGLKAALLHNRPELLNLTDAAKALQVQSTLRNIWLHVIDAQGKSFYRSWTSKRGDDIKAIRPDVGQFLKDPKPAVIMSVGWFDMTLKATVPIFDQERLIGMFETIAKVNSIDRKMRQSGFEMVVLADKRFAGQIVAPFTKRFLGDYYVANVEAKPENLELLAAYGTERFLEENQAYTLFESAQKLAYIYEVPDINGAPMGYFILFYDVNEINMKDIYLMRDQLISIFVTVFVVLMAIFYYVYLNRHKQFMEHINVELEHKVQEKTKTLNHLAHHDTLTGLPNRLLFMDRLEQAIKHARRHETGVFVLFLDLDRFKEVNDSMGHKAGDILLQHVTGTLIAHLREVDTVARLGGDEFTVILEELTATQVQTVCEKLLEAMKTPISVMGQRIYVTFSIGISAYPQNAQTSDELLRNADTAMYKAKHLGKNRYYFYDESLTEHTVWRATLERELHRAMEFEEFIPYFQPKIDYQTREIIGVEALIRWKHPTKGIITPQAFVELAQELGLMIAIDRWMIKQSILAVQSWQNLGMEVGRLAVNVTAKQLEQPDFIDFIRETLAQTFFNARQLEIEITENEIMQDPQKAVSMLNAIKALGVGISIDDFGTGYSSLAYLKRLPIDTLKIDKSFIDELVIDEDDRSIVGSIIAMANNLKLGVIAEGVESVAQKELLCQMGCCWIQGYVYSKPVSAEDFVLFYREFCGA